MKILPAHNLLALVPILTLAFMTATPVEAGEFALGFDVGYTDFDSEVASDSDFRADFRASYFFNDKFELEGQFLRATAILDTELTVYCLNGVFNFRTDTAFVPYVLVGVGTANLASSPLFGISVDDDGVAYQGAIGVRYYFGSAQSFGLRGELSALSEDTFDESSTHTSLVAGLTWKLGS
ncbi:MAG: porin family protein [bacterium]|nr:porin family protein [bacterium]